MFRSMAAAVQRARYAVKAGLLTSGALLGMTSGAQAMLGAPDPLPERMAMDANTGTDIASGSFNYTATDVVIGNPEQGGLSFSRTWTGSGWRDNTLGTVTLLADQYAVSFGGASERFSLGTGVLQSRSGNGAT